MKVKQLMERAGMTETGRAIAYIKDGLAEINMLSETHVKAQKVDIKKNKRFYDMPNDSIQILEIRVKNHLNSKGEYRSIPRLIYEPKIKDADGS